MRLLCYVFIASISFPLVSNALLTLRFEGVANFVGTNLQPEIAIGDAYTFDLTYDINSPDTGFDNFSLYAASSATFSLQTSGAGNFSFTDNSPTIQIDEPGSFERFTVNAGSAAGSISDSNLFNYSLSMFNDGPGVFNNGELPTSLNRADFSSNPSSVNFQLFFLPGTSADNVRFSIDTITVVPEPSHFGIIVSLVVSGLIALRRRRA